MTFLCVLKTGGRYEAAHVERLRRQVGSPVVCLTDDPRVLPPVIPLKHGWPGWWSKLELFEHDFGRACYLDLDVQVRDLDFIERLEGASFYAMADAYWPGTLNSSVMVWTGRRTDIVSNFTPKRIREFRLGDQEWILKNCGSWTPLHPPHVISYKKHGRRADASIIVFHGNPKPWDLDPNL